MPGRVVSERREDIGTNMQENIHGCTFVIDKNTTEVAPISHVALSYGRKKAMTGQKRRKHLMSSESTGLFREGESCDRSERYMHLLSDAELGERTFR